ncbi:DNA polymerase III subunit chi [Marinimicrobium sp. ABcell2]|uniref:DNA polymerase III subunit chi n=1 Tax=Marinimicrobium sp. ABcell2 TaxID=3069751 RepID=UPI0027B686E4|nr:DNA polymerase III subunit chi [Marinimicrobium sp. ABcell2]MDQ2077241.1 DNA polymerase III subunit chi [Marinimicrobium sp. ABcell2]
MTEVSFYILQDSEAQARWQFACRLVEKAQRLGHEVLVVVDSAAEADYLDELLWSFNPESFVPHRRIDAQDQPAAPVEITANGDCGDHHDVLVNLSQRVPEHFSRFQRLSEVVIQEPQVLQCTREHFSFYKSRGYPIQSRNI